MAQITRSTSLTVADGIGGVTDGMTPNGCYPERTRDESRRAEERAGWHGFGVFAETVVFVFSQRSEGDRHIFPGKTMSEWFERFGGSSLGRGKNETVAEL